MKQSNCHARSRQKRKRLKKEATRKRIWLNRASKLIKSGRIDEVPRKAILAIELQAKIFEFETLRRHSRMDKNPFNQRQKRKRWRQNPHLRKAA